MAQNINAGLSLPISLPVDPKRPYQDQQFLQSLSQVATAYVQFGPSSQRPSGASPSPNFIGRSFFDQTLNTPVWWNGTTWVSSTSAIGVFSPNGMMLTSPTGKAEATNPALNGQILIGSTGNSPTLGYIVGGTGITVTNEAGQILITNSSPGITVNNVSDNTTYNLGMTDQSTGAITILDVAAQSLTYNPYSYTLSLGPVLSTTPGILNGPGGLSLSTASNIRLTVDSTGAWLLPTNAGTVNQVITSQGTGTPPIWASPTIQIDDVGTTNTVYNMLFTNVDSGSVNYLDVSTSTLTYNPSSQTINGGLGLNLTSGGVFTATSATNTTISSGANTVISTGNVFTATSVSTTTLSSGGGTTITSTGGNVTVNPAGGLFLSSGTGAALTITSGDRILMQSTQDTTVNSSTLIDITSAQYTHITTGEDFTVTATGDAALIGNNVGLSSSPGGIALNSATSVGIVSGTQLIELISGAALTTSSVTNTTITGGTSVSLVSTSGDTSITSGAAIGTTSTTSTNIAAGTGLNLSSVGNTDFTTGSTLRLAIDNTGAWLLPTSAGTQYQTIQSQGAGTPPIWADESLAITNATTTNATYFPTFISSISGRATTLDISTYFTFNPDLGILSLEPGSTSGPGTITGPLGLKLSTNAVGRLTIDNTGAWLLPSSAGSSLQAIISNGAGTPPTWQGVVNSFQTSLSGLSPSTPATGNVTLSGVLGIASGGTGATTAEQALLNLSSNQILANPGGDLYLFSDRWITSSSSLPVAANGIWQAVAYGNGTFVAVGLGAGVGISTNAAGIASLRQLENTTQTSTIYGNQAYVTGMSSSASMGLTGSAATEAGVLAAGFGAGNQILQQANLNGTEGTGTQLMNALTSQQLGVPYLGLYSAEQKLKGVSGGNKAVMAQDKGIMNILGNLGINPSSIKKKSDLNSYAMELSMILPSLVGDQKLADPQLAVNWVWAKIQQMHNITHPNKKPAQGSLFMSLVDDVGKAALGVGGAVRATANTLAHYNIDTGAEIAGLVSGRSQTQINHWIQSADHSIDNVEHGASTGIDQIRHGISSAMGGGVSSSARSMIEVKVHPASAMAISASLKHFNQQRNTSKIPLNHLGQV